MARCVIDIVRAGRIRAINRMPSSSCTVTWNGPCAVTVAGVVANVRSLGLSSLGWRVLSADLTGVFWRGASEARGRCFDPVA